METNKEKIRTIFYDEISKCNSFEYRLEINNLSLLINTKKFYKKWFNISIHLYAKRISDDKTLYKNVFTFRNYHFFHESIWLSYDFFWLKFIEQTHLKNVEIRELIKDFIKNEFDLKEVLVNANTYTADKLWEEL